MQAITQTKATHQTQTVLLMQEILQITRAVKQIKTKQITAQKTILQKCSNKHKEKELCSFFTYKTRD